MRQQLFRNKTDAFIETGSHIGFGIELALHSGFSKIYSIELMPEFYEACVEKFKDNDKVELILGDSFYKLEEILEKNPGTPFTYWLDGHYSGAGTAFGVKESPLLKELEVILSRGVSGELIYVDDMRLYRNFDEELHIKSISELIAKYVPDAKMHYEASIHDPLDILVIDY